MGQEIVYCSKCLRRLTTADFERGLGLRVGSSIACTECLPAVLATLTPEEQQGFAKQRTARQAGPRQGSSAKHPRIKPSERASRNRWLLPVSAGLGALLLVGIVLMAPGKPPAPPPDQLPADDARVRAAREAAERSRKAKDEVEAQIAAMSRDMAELAAQVRPLVEREEYRKAIDLCERARGTRSDPEWRDLIESRLREIRKAAEAAYATLRQKAGDARKKGAEEEVKAARDRVARWQLADLAQDFERHLAGLVPQERPWTPVFDGRTTDFLMSQARSGWAVRDGALVRLTDNAAQTSRQFHDGEVRIRFEASGVDTLWFVMRQAAAEGWRVGWNTVAFSPLDGKACELIFTCRGDSVTATLNGRPLPLEAKGKPRSGLLQFNGRAKMLKYTSIDYRDLP